MSNLIDIQVFEDQLGGNPKFRIKLPAVPRPGDSVTLPDDHYLVEEVFWQAHDPGPSPSVRVEWADHIYYTIRLIVRRKFTEE